MAVAIKYNFFHVFIRGILNSYSQIFFSDKKLFAFIILFVTFFDRNTGLCGLIGVLSANGIAYAMGFNRHNIASGFYGFNALLVALGIGVLYNINIELFVVLLFASFLVLMLTLVFEGVIGKYRLPYLSIPFLLTLWLVVLATREFSALSLSQSGVYAYNEMFSWGGFDMIRIYEWYVSLNIEHSVIMLYFKSLGAIFFQYNVIAGFVLAVGLLLYSRQAFLLSLLGFVSAFYFYKFIGADISTFYFFVGFNFILTAIAVGGFFIVPSFYSYLYVILLTPIISVLLASTSALLAPYQLSVLSLPFNIIVIVFLYILKFREYRLNIPEIVALPKGTPEENLYMQKNAKMRFSGLHYIPIELPLRGEWRVSQAHDGDITHKDKWRHAWDFDIVDNNGKTYSGDGLLLEDYYCYNKPVLAPADGYIESIVYDVPDNEIGDVNLENNWGNTIIIKHTPLLYSKISHLKAGTFKVQVGDFVKKGVVVAHAGSSGRSPEPHVHFQLQATPHISSDTLNYPIAHYIKHLNILNHKNISVESYNYPKQGDIVSNIQNETLISDAYHFIPGQKLNFEWNSKNNKKRTAQWEVVTDIFNNTYLYCTETKSKAYTYNDGKIHYFTNFEGSRNSLLYYFYLGSFKILMSFYKNLEFVDTYPLNKVCKKNILLWIQDFISPFYIFIDCRFKCLHYKLEESIDVEAVMYKTKTMVSVFGKPIRNIEYEIEIKENKILTFTVIEKNSKIKAICTE